MKKRIIKKKPTLPTWEYTSGMEWSPNQVLKLFREKALDKYGKKLDHADEVELMNEAKAKQSHGLDMDSIYEMLAEYFHEADEYAKGGTVNGKKKRVVKKKARSKEDELIREYNEENHVGSGLTGEDLYSLDESELEDFENWKKSQYKGVIKNITKGTWLSEEKNGKVKHTKDEGNALCFYDEGEAVAVLEMLNDEKADSYTLIDMMAKGGEVKGKRRIVKKWIAKALSGGHKGALRKVAKREGILHGKHDTLTTADLHKLEKQGGKVAKEAHLAETLSKFEKGGEVKKRHVVKKKPAEKHTDEIEIYKSDDLASFWANPKNENKELYFVEQMSGEEEDEEDYFVIGHQTKAFYLDNKYWDFDGMYKDIDEAIREAKAEARKAANGIYGITKTSIGQFEKGGEVKGKRRIVKKGQSWFVTKKPDEKIYVLYDFARTKEQAQNMLRDLHEGSPIAHKSTSEGGEYNIYVKRGSILWREKGGSIEEGYKKFKEGTTVKVDEAYLTDEASGGDATPTATVMSEPSDNEALVQIKYENGVIDYLGQEWLEPIGGSAKGKRRIVKKEVKFIPKSDKKILAGFKKDFKSLLRERKAAKRKVVKKKKA